MTERSDDIADRLRAATELLEQVARDRSALHELTDEERHRLVNAAGDVFAPDVELRRQRNKARRKQVRADRRERE